jgi:NADP-dependent 3-hydroxy acid dehydrogenase YdfG
MRKRFVRRSALQTAILDVTNPAHMVGLVARLPQLTGDAGLYGVVNNAGVVVAGPTENMTTAEWRTRYLVGTDAKMQAMMKWLMPDRMLDSFLIRVLGLK